MTVFMSPRTNYDLGRYHTHQFMSWIVMLCLLIGTGTIAYRIHEEETNYADYTLGSLVVLSLFSRNGRRTVGRTVSETFYGTLGTFTGVFGNTNEDGYMGR